MIGNDAEPSAQITINGKRSQNVPGRKLSSGFAQQRGTCASQLVIAVHTERLTPPRVPRFYNEQYVKAHVLRHAQMEYAMNRLALGFAAAVTSLVVVPNLASALSAVTTGSTDLRAGPAFDFPVVDQIPSDVRVNVHGCVRAYRWCDVSWRDARGWVPGEELAYLYQGQRVTIVEYGPRIGLPVVVFSFDTYWNRHYRSRSWYGERARWRTVWRDREGGEGSPSDRIKKPQEDRTESRRDEGERRLDRRGNRDERPDVRNGRGDRRDRGEARGYVPEIKSIPRREIDRGARQGDENPGGRTAPNRRDGDPRSSGGLDRGGPGQGDRRP